MPVNPDIAHILFLRGYMEKIGRGTLKIIEACKEAGLKSPKWDISENKVTLRFFGPKKNEDVVGANDNAGFGENDGAIDGAIDGATKIVKKKLGVFLGLIKDKPGLRLPEYKSLKNLGSKRTMERYLQLLKEADLIEFKGDAAQIGGYYITEKLKSYLE